VRSKPPVILIRILLAPSIDVSSSKGLLIALRAASMAPSSFMHVPRPITAFPEF